MKDKRFNRRLVDAVTMFIVTALSFMLLVYVGYGEGRRTYEQFHVEKLVGHGSVVQNAMENYLRAGLPLDQYAGFTALAEPIVKIQDIDALAVYDQTGRQLFLVADKAQPALKLPEPSAAIKNITDKIETDYGSTHYQVIVPLRTRFETVGSLVVTSPTEIVTNHLDKSFQWVLYPLIGLSLAFAIAVFIASPYMARVRTPWLQIGYAVIFLTMAGVVVGTLISVYAEGVQSKTRAAAVTLSQRLNDIVEFNLRLREFDGLERTFADYRRLNPEISEAALINEGVVQIATDPTKVGKPWMSDSRTYEHFVELTPPNTPRRIIVAVAVPKDIIYRQIESSVRNFAALFVASGFMAGLFLQVASSMQRLRFSSSDRDQSALGGATALIIVKPIFFLAVFLEHLTYSFLPKFMQDAALASGMSAAFASAPFTAYYLCFALSLIPAGHFADRYGPRPVIWGGMVLASATLFCLIFPLGILPITAVRGLSGIGQGMLFIGIQSYILAVASPEKKTQGAAIIVFGFQGGMISGMAIGSLLVTYLQPEGVFVISGAIGAAMAVYSLMLIPREVVAAPSQRGLGMTLHQVASDLKEVIHSGEFLRTMFCIGVPAKAILTGNNYLRAAALARTAGLPARRDRPNPDAVWHRRGCGERLYLASRRPHRQYRSRPVLGRRAERRWAGAHRADGFERGRQRNAQHERRGDRRRTGRHCARVHQCARHRARGAAGACRSHRGQSGHHDLPVPRADRPRCRPIPRRPALPALGSEPAHHRLDRHRHGDARTSVHCS